ELAVYKIDGNAAGRSVEVDDAIFACEPNEHAVYLAVKAQQTNLRQGNAATKTRSMVSGGGKKPWKQKGRGTARAGTSRSPIWRGGGTAHGPQPHEFSMNLPKKVKKLARISVIAAKTREDDLRVVEDFTVESRKTKDFASILRGFGLQETKTLVLVAEYDNDILLASRNIGNVKVQLASDASTFDLLESKKLLITESAIKKLEGILQS
ncbi:50S ribosomal protein L4, partial [candidate division KSB1 bacterium]|nr:50S ribosomal protein L4 [candidate division KSB1 bacterium]